MMYSVGFFIDSILMSSFTSFYFKILLCPSEKARHFHFFLLEAISITTSRVDVKTIKRNADIKF